MTRNLGTLRDEDGDCSDWLELCNEGSEPVSLSGCSLLWDGAEEICWQLDDLTLEAEEYRLIFASKKNRRASDGELHTSFRLDRKKGSLRLMSPEGAELDRVEWSEKLPDGCSLCRTASGTEVSALPTPGYPNSAEGYRMLQSNSHPSGPLIISEVMNANRELLYQRDHGCCDWVELQNISSEEVEISDYYLSDDPDFLQRSPLTAGTLAPGAYALVFLDGSGTDGFGTFKLDAAGEGLFLSDGEGCVDALWVPRTSVDGSFGRSEEWGAAYFSVPTPGRENGHAALCISEKPAVSISGGIFNDAAGVTVELFGQGEVYYTLDGSLPTAKSERYTEPLTLRETTTLRAVQIEEDCIPSRALTETYLIGENLTLPAVCLSTDDPQAFFETYNACNKTVGHSANISFYEDGGSFSKDCDVNLAGHTCQNLYPKKGLRVHFREYYDGRLLHYDIFGEDVQEFSSLTIRAGGQDTFTNVFRNELWQDLAAEKFDTVLSMYSRFCVLFINGEYYGIYALKEDFSKQYYASHAGVDKDSVETEKIPAGPDTAFWKEVYEYCLTEDLTTPEGYAYLDERLDMDSFIDWFLLEGFSGNVDLFSNLRLFRSSQEDGKWRFGFFDLDQTLNNPGGSFAPFFGYVEHSPYQIRQIMLGLSKNPLFREKMFRRYGELSEAVFSNEDILRRIDSYEELLQPEMERSWKRWFPNSDSENWLVYNDKLRRTIKDCDWEKNAILRLCEYLDLPDAERMEYFGF